MPLLPGIGGQAVVEFADGGGVLPGEEVGAALFEALDQPG